MRIMAYKDPARQKAYSRAYREKNREKRTAYNKVWHEAHPGRRALYRAANLEKDRKAKRKYQGVIDATGEIRRGMCPICLHDGPLVCDHAHGPDGSGLVRGWICSLCNRGLGYFKDDAGALARARAYLLAGPGE